jgi:hypothetical protein
MNYRVALLVDLFFKDWLWLGLVHFNSRSLAHLRPQQQAQSMAQHDYPVG